MKGISIELKRVLCHTRTGKHVESSESPSPEEANLERLVCQSERKIYRNKLEIDYNYGFELNIYLMPVLRSARGKEI